MRCLLAGLSALLLALAAACGPGGLPKMPPPEYEEDPAPDAGAVTAPPAAVGDAAAD